MFVVQVCWRRGGGEYSEDYLPLSVLSVSHSAVTYLAGKGFLRPGPGGVAALTRAVASPDPGPPDSHIHTYIPLCWQVTNTIIDNNNNNNENDDKKVTMYVQFAFCFV